MHVTRAPRMALTKWVRQVAPVPSSEARARTGVELHAERLRQAGARTLTGVVSDTGGVIRAKTVPARRIESFARSGMGASLTWPVFCVDNGIAMTPELGVVGD